MRQIIAICDRCGTEADGTNGMPSGWRRSGWRHLCPQCSQTDWRLGPHPDDGKGRPAGPSERNAAIAALYQSGHTLQAIADTYDLTKEGIRQILRRNKIPKIPKRPNKIRWPIQAFKTRMADWLRSIGYHHCWMHADGQGEWVPLHWFSPSGRKAHICYLCQRKRTYDRNQSLRAKGLPVGYQQTKENITRATRKYLLRRRRALQMWHHQTMILRVWGICRIRDTITSALVRILSAITS